MKPEDRMDFSLISLDLLREYLLLDGWLRASADQVSRSVSSREFEFAPSFMSMRRVKESPEVFLLRDDHRQPVEVVLPKSQQAANYRSQLRDVIQTLADLHGWTVAETVYAVHSIGYDVIRNRIPTTTFDRGSIALGVAQAYVNRTKDLLASAATTEIEPKPYFDRTMKEGKAFSDHCRFGHTFSGSFGFTIESALPRPTEPMENIPQPVPFERRVVRRLAQGLRSVQQAVVLDDLSPIVDHPVVGLSANSCEIIADIVSSTPARDLTFDISFSPVWKEVELPSQRLEVNLSEPHIEAFRAAAKRMRNPDVSEPAEIAGLITDLSTNANPLDLSDTRSNRSVVVLWSSEKFGDIRIHVNLSATQYLDALSLHREAKPMRLRGVLSKTGRRWTLAQDPPSLAFELKS